MLHSSQSSQFMFRNALWRHAEKAALVVGGSSYSYRELDDLSSRLAAQLRALGLNKGDRLAIVLRNCVEFAITDLAILKLGAVKVPLNEMLSRSDVSYMIGHSGARMMVVHSSLKDKLDKTELANTDLAAIVEVDDVGAGLDAGHRDWRQLLAEPVADFEWGRWGRRTPPSSSTPVAPPGARKVSCTRTAR